MKFDSEKFPLMAEHYDMMAGNITWWENETTSELLDEAFRFLLEYGQKANRKTSMVLNVSETEFEGPYFCITEVPSDVLDAGFCDCYFEKENEK